MTSVTEAAPPALQDKERRLRDFLAIPPEVSLIPSDARLPALTPKLAEHLGAHNLEWHAIPAADAAPFDDPYLTRLYPRRPRNFDVAAHGLPSCRDALANGHREHQGMAVAVETTLKPRYLPENRQCYGTLYGFDSTADPFAAYLRKAGFLTSTRYGHHYDSLCHFLRLVDGDWRSRGLMPEGYRLTLCPPVVFNLAGTVFHPEWSTTETLELGFYWDQHGNANCFAVGSNGPGDFSYVHQIETDSDWTQLGFRLALIPK